MQAVVCPAFYSKKAALILIIVLVIINLMRSYDLISMGSPVMDIVTYCASVACSKFI